MDPRIILIGIAIAIVLSGGTGVMAASNTTGAGNNTDIGTAQQLEQLTSNNSLANASTMTSFNDTTNQTSNQTSNQTANMSG